MGDLPIVICCLLLQKEAQLMKLCFTISFKGSAHVLPKHYSGVLHPVVHYTKYFPTQ